MHADTQVGSHDHPKAKHHRLRYHAHHDVATVGRLIGSHLHFVTAKCDRSSRLRHAYAATDQRRLCPPYARGTPPRSYPRRKIYHLATHCGQVAIRQSILGPFEQTDVTNAETVTAAPRQHGQRTIPVQYVL